VIVAWNSREELARSIPALVPELAEGDELIVVDNDSSDDSAALVAELAPRARVVNPGSNLGFAAGANFGAAEARGELVVLLNPDASPLPGWGAAIRRPQMDGRGWAGWMSLVTAEGGQVVNTLGGALHFTGIAWAGGAGDPVPADLRPTEVPFLSGACLAIPRATWERLGGFGERYFLYHEDVDLSLRLRLEGGRIGIEPAAVVDHDYEFSARPGKYRYLERNRWATVLRDYPAPLLALLTPALLATELALMLVSIPGGWARQKWEANLDVLRALGPTLRERRAIQSEREIPSGEFAAFLTPDLDSPYLGRAGRIAPLRWALRAYWRVVRFLLRAPGPDAAGPPARSLGNGGDVEVDAHQPSGQAQ
jgi:GT2 family glycosyltransferase